MISTTAPTRKHCGHAAWVSPGLWRTDRTNPQPGGGPDNLPLSSLSDLIEPPVTASSLLLSTRRESCVL